MGTNIQDLNTSMNVSIGASFLNEWGSPIRIDDDRHEDNLNWAYDCEDGW